MNCFMGYNPLASKQVKITVWVSEQDGASPVAPSNPSEGDCFIVYATDEAMLSNTPTSKKTYTNGDWADAEGGGGGGGATFPTFTMDGQGDMSCDMTYAEVKASYVASVDEHHVAPVTLVSISDDTQVLAWGYDSLATGELLSLFADVPDTVTEGLALFLMTQQAPLALYADDGNFYELKQ